MKYRIVKNHCLYFRWLPVIRTGLYMETMTAAYAGFSIRIGYWYIALYTRSNS